MDLRTGFNDLSDVIVNRPEPLREFDQIYMKAADMLIQADHIAKWMTDRDVVFIGDGDALALTVVHLHGSGHLEAGPRTVHVLDFDERVVNSIKRFAEQYGYQDRIGATLYNAGDPLPAEHLGRYGGFYTNPPFGGSNDGASVVAFMQRGIEASGADAICCAAIADYAELEWCDAVLRKAQRLLLDNGYAIAEMVPTFHHYHLDDTPDLTSCSLIGRRRLATAPQVESKLLPPELRRDFYGKGSPLRIRYVRDLTNGGKLASRNHRTEPFPEDPK